MLKVVEKYGKDKQIKFNPSKTVFLVFNDKIRRAKQIELEDSMTKLKLDGQFIDRVYEIKYLGICLQADLKNKKHMKEMVKKTIGASYKLLIAGFKSRSSSRQTKSTLYKA